MSEATLSPAEQAANKARDDMFACIDRGKSFRLEAGAGAGKTYSLIQALRYLILKKGACLLRHHQRVACISYTNVASDEITSRIDGHTVIHSSTIHSFCWLLIKDFQPVLRKELPSIDYWTKKIAESGIDVGSRAINYDEFGHPAIKDTHISLRHDDILILFVRLMEYAKFRNLLTANYPIVLIDEYQDTDKNLVESLKKHFISSESGPLLGFFGDHWQKIYGDGCGLIDHPNLKEIGKEANFRSAPIIVNYLNRMRPSLPQKVKDPSAQGSVAIYHTNSWSGARQTGQHWGGDLPTGDAHDFLEALKERLVAEGWDFAPEKTKILMLTHKVLAAEQGYANLSNVFEYNDSFTKKENSYISFLFDALEPVCIAYKEKRYGEMFNILGSRTVPIRSHLNKTEWANDMNKLLELRASATVGEVIDHLKITKRPRLPETIESKEAELQRTTENPGEEEATSIKHARKLREVAYQEVIAAARFVNDQTPFSTKHGVKGAEFENVLIVLGRGWNLYNFNEFLEWSNNPAKIPSGKMDKFERNRNLFYVACSRSMKRTAILFTQELSGAALNTLAGWFGQDVIHAL